MLNTLIELQCDYCGAVDHCIPPKSYAKQRFKELGYVFMKGYTFCDKECYNNYWIGITNGTIKQQL